MPFRRESSASPEPTRRVVLTAMAAGPVSVLAGCTVGGEPDDDRSRRRPRKREPETDPDVALAGLALRDEQAALDALEATVRRHPGLEARLAPAIGAHTEHVRLLTEAAPDDPDGAANGLTARPSVSPAEPTVPRSARRALRQAAATEQWLNTAMKRHAFAAESGQFARLLAGMSASCAQHAAVLTGDTENGSDR